MQRNTFGAVVALAAAVVLATLGGCGGSSSNGTPPDPLDGVVGGTATTGSTAVADATVKLTSTTGAGGPYMTTTDMAGAYELTVPPGAYSLLAYRDVEFNDFTASVTVVAETLTPQDIAFQAARTYVGSDTCLGCHTSMHPETAAFVRSGHPFKLNKVSGGVAPTYPFSNIDDVDMLIADDGMDITDGLADPNGTETDNALGTPADWDDITYVIGGFGWKARFLDADGYIVTGTQVQYNFFNPGDGLWHFLDGGGLISAYHNNEQGKVFNCGNCHTTGWRRYDATLNPARRDDLPGMDGTFAYPGIQCEACHGAGSEHAAAPSSSNITGEASPRTLEQLTHHSAGFGLPVACGECHTRDGERDYPSYVSAAQGAGWAGDANWSGLIGGRISASGGYVRHHEQYDELVGINPDTMTSVRSAAFAATHGDCGTCHDYHSTTRFQNISGDQPGMFKDCTDCHSEPKYVQTNHVVSGNASCIDCHMPLFSKSAQATAAPVAGLPSAGGRPGDGDVRSHIFRIDLSMTDQFTDGTGGFAYPWITGFYSCNRCHYAGGDAFALDTPSGTIHQDP